MQSITITNTYTHMCSKTLSIAADIIRSSNDLLFALAEAQGYIKPQLH